MIVNIDPPAKDPLKLVKRNKALVRHLTENGMDGREIRKMLDDWHGVKFTAPIRFTKPDLEERKQIDYAIRNAKALISSKATTGEEKEALNNMLDRLSSEKVPKKISLKYHPREEGDAKSFKQMTGLQVLDLYEYMMRFNGLDRNTTPFKQIAVFDLIAEILEINSGVKYTRDQIKTFYTNQYAFHK